MGWMTGSRVGPVIAALPHYLVWSDCLVRHVLIRLASWNRMSLICFVVVWLYATLCSRVPASLGSFLYLLFCPSSISVLGIGCDFTPVYFPAITKEGVGTVYNM